MAITTDTRALRLRTALPCAVIDENFFEVQRIFKLAYEVCTPLRVLPVFFETVPELVACFDKAVADKATMAEIEQKIGALDDIVREIFEKATLEVSVTYEGYTFTRDDSVIDGVTVPEWWLTNPYGQDCGLIHDIDAFKSVISRIIRGDTLGISPELQYEDDSLDTFTQSLAVQYFERWHNR